MIYAAHANRAPHFPFKFLFGKLTFRKFFCMTSFFIGGLRIGKSPYWALNVSFPFAFLRFEDHALVFGWKFFFLKREYRLSYREIEYIRRANGFFSRGVQIFHHDDRIPPYLLFWQMRPQVIISLFEMHGIGLRQ